MYSKVYVTWKDIMRWDYQLMLIILWLSARMLTLLMKQYKQGNLKGVAFSC